MRIVLASARPDLRLALEILLREELGTEVVGTVSEAASLTSLLKSSRPDLVILDWDLPGYTPIQLLAEAKQLRRSPQIIVLGRDEGVRKDALAAGADFFVLAGDPPVVLVAAVLQSRERHRAGTGTAVTLCGGVSQAAAGGQMLDGTTEELV